MNKEMKETLKETSKKIANAMKEWVKAKWAASQEKANVERKAALAQQAQLRNQQQKEYLYSIACAIASDLFTAIGQQEYSCLSPIKTPATLRIGQIGFFRGSVVFEFCINKQNPNEAISAYLKKVFVNDLNRDLLRMRSTLIAEYGPEQVQIFNPFLFAGLSVVACRDLGASVGIAVTTAYPI